MLQSIVAVVSAQLTRTHASLAFLLVCVAAYAIVGIRRTPRSR